MTFENYKLLHYCGLMLLFFGLGSVVAANALTSKISPKIRLVSALTHGFGLLIIIVTGFGMSAKLGLVNGFPKWIYAKIVIWLLLGISYSLAKRQSKNIPLLITAFFIGLGAVAAYIALNKPF